MTSRLLLARPVHPLAGDGRRTKLNYHHDIEGFAPEVTCFALADEFKGLA
jgi:hypothetical protein